MYSIIKPILFRFDPEQIHNFVLKASEPILIDPIEQGINKVFKLEDPRLQVECMGLKFANPVGLAAGFDKNCEAPKLWGALGFGFVEFGSVTALPQYGNDKPRIFRLPEDKALINRMGFPSLGINVVSEKIKKLRQGNFQPLIGVNIGKSKVVELEKAPEDYEESLIKIIDYVDYVVINVSSPNTPGLRELQGRKHLEQLLGRLQQTNSNKTRLLLKVAPDLTKEALKEVVECVNQFNITGIVATNTTLSRNGLKTQINENGGLSGSPLFERSLDFVREIYNQTSGKLPIIGVGGISSGEDAYKMIIAGASLVQIYTGLVYQGPRLVKSINQFLLKVVKSRGLSSVKDLVGIEAR